jgi:hypothetical protein
MTLPKTRKDACKVGSKFYKTGKPCKHGHDSKRYTSSKSCYECHKANWSKSNEAKKKRLENNWLEEQLKRKDYLYRSMYGITFLEYRNMSADQDYKCAICHKEERFMEIEDWKQKGYLGDLHVDHCHDTGRVRGLLCKECNMALGVLNNKELLTKAKEYLEENKYELNEV